MKASRATAALLTLVAVPLGAPAGSAHGATTEIGAVSEIRAAALPSPDTLGGFTVQIAEAKGSYAVPAGYGTITAWSHSTGGVAGPLTFKVYRPTGALRQFVAVASDTRTVTARTVHTFPVQIPVQPGDRIGLSSDDVELAYETFNPADKLGFFDPDPPQGTTKATDGEPFPEFKLDVAATLDDGAGGGVQPPPTYDIGGGSGDPVPVRLPTVSRLRISPRAFAAARRGPSARAVGTRRVGARVSYTADVAARVRFTVRQTRPGRRKGSGDTARCVRVTRANRRAPRCRRTVILRGGFTRAAKAGGNRFRFTGRLRGKRLKPGRYKLTATPSAGGTNGRSVSRRFRVIR